MKFQSPARAFRGTQNLLYISLMRPQKGVRLNPCRGIVLEPSTRCETSKTHGEACAPVEDGHEITTTKDSMAFDAPSGDEHHLLENARAPLL
jgi:hypothetical protein